MKFDRIYYYSNTCKIFVKTPVAVNKIVLWLVFEIIARTEQNFCTFSIVVDNMS